MSRKRMFNWDLCMSTKVTDLSHEAFRMYVYINLFCNDDGYTDALKGIQAITSTGPSEVEELKSSGLIFQFDNGAVLVIHWLLHNSLSAKTYRQQMEPQFRSMVRVEPSGRYTLDLEDPDTMTIDEYRSLKTSGNKGTSPDQDPSN